MKEPVSLPFGDDSPGVCVSRSTLATGATCLPSRQKDYVGIFALTRNLPEMLHKSITEYDNHVVELSLTPL